VVGIRHHHYGGHRRDVPYGGALRRRHAALDQPRDLHVQHALRLQVRVCLDGRSEQQDWSCSCCTFATAGSGRRSILYKTRLPFVVVFNKTDVVAHDFAVEWMTDSDAFQLAAREVTTYMGSLLQSMSLVLEEFYEHLRVCYERLKERNGRRYVALTGAYPEGCWRWCARPVRWRVGRDGRWDGRILCGRGGRRQGVPQVRIFRFRCVRVSTILNGRRCNQALPDVLCNNSEFVPEMERLMKIKVRFDRAGTLFPWRGALTIPRQRLFHCSAIGGARRAAQAGEPAQAAGGYGA